MPRRLFPLLAALGIILGLTTIPGVFTMDEPNHLAAVMALRQCRLTIPGTEGFSASREWLYFDPGSRLSLRFSTPVVPRTPSLYPFLVIPFSFLGWRGLAGVNLIAFLGSLAMVFCYARWYSQNDASAWLAVATLVMGSYCIEYAQGLWPHMLSVGLCTGAFLLSSRAERLIHPFHVSLPD